MTAPLKALAAFGQHHRRDFQVVENIHLLELGPHPILRVNGWAKGELPNSVDRSSDVVPNYGYDGIKYIQTDEKRRTAFWNTQRRFFPRLADLFTQTEKAIAAGKLKIVGSKDIDNLAKAAETGWIALAVKGEPIVKTKAFRAKWSKEIGQEAYKYMEREASCLISGEKCIPLKVHPRFGDFGGSDGKASALSFNNEIFEFRGRSQGENFPISYDAGRNYISGLQKIADTVRDRDPFTKTEIYRRHRYAIPVTDKDTVGIFPSEGPESEYLLSVLPLLDSSLTRELLETAWERLNLVRPSKSKVNLLHFKMSKGRIGLMRHETITEEQLHAALLRMKDAVGPRTLLRFLRGTSKAEGGHPSPFPQSHWTPLLFSFLLNEPFGVGVKRLLSARINTTNPLHMDWLNASQVL